MPDTSNFFSVSAKKDGLFQCVSKIELCIGKYVLMLNPMLILKTHC